MSTQFQPRDFRVPVMSDRARSERRYLLASSAISLGIIYTGSVPTRISTFGIEFAQSERTAILHVLGAVVVYFFFAFIFYAIPDFMTLKLAWHAARERVEITNRERSLGADDDRINEYANDPDSRSAITQQLKQETLSSAYTLWLLPTALMDFVVPLFVGLIALISLFTAKP